MYFFFCSACRTVISPLPLLMMKMSLNPSFMHSDCSVAASSCRRDGDPSLCSKTIWRGVLRTAPATACGCAATGTVGRRNRMTCRTDFLYDACEYADLPYPLRYFGIDHIQDFGSDSPPPPPSPPPRDHLQQQHLWQIDAAASSKQAASKQQASSKQAASSKQQAMASPSVAAICSGSICGR